MLVAQPALGAPRGPAGGAHGTADDPAATGRWNPHPALPGPVLIPRKDTKVAPLTSPL
jgi:hypothetical protein